MEYWISRGKARVDGWGCWGGKHMDGKKKKKKNRHCTYTRATPSPPPTPNKREKERKKKATTTNREEKKRKKGNERWGGGVGGGGSKERKQRRKKKKKKKSQRKIKAPPPPHLPQAIKKIKKASVSEVEWTRTPLTTSDMTLTQPRGPNGWNLLHHSPSSAAAAVACWLTDKSASARADWHGAGLSEATSTRTYKQPQHRLPYIAWQGKQRLWAGLA